MLAKGIASQVSLWSRFGYGAPETTSPTEPAPWSSW
jgi:hypothetical protein